MVHLEGIPVEIRNKALREAINQTPRNIVAAVLDECGLTKDEKASILEHRDGADLIWISNKICTSDRTLDRRRKSALDNIRRELEA
jgi:hypothetical protein